MDQLTFLLMKCSDEMKTKQKPIVRVTDDWLRKKANLIRLGLHIQLSIHSWPFLGHNLLSTFEIRDLRLQSFEMSPHKDAGKAQKVCEGQTKDD